MSKLWDAVLPHVDGDAVVELARQALRIRSLSGEEEEVARFFVASMRNAGIDAELQPVPATEQMGPSFNAIGRAPGTGGGPSLMFNGHIDHNPVCDGWTRDPYGGVIENGWLFGFVHMKAANVAYIAALEAVKKAGIELRGDVVLALVCGELRGGIGTRHALGQGVTADYFVLGEPTELEVAFNHTASIVLKVHVLGRMKHFATVDVPGARGVNAVEKMAKVIAALGRSHTLAPPVAAGGWLSYAPADALPHIFTGMRISIALSVIGAVVAEFVAATQGLGYLIFSGATNLDTKLVFAGVILLAIMGIVLFQIVRLAQGWLVPWATDAHEGEA